AALDHYEEEDLARFAEAEAAATGKKPVQRALAKRLRRRAARVRERAIAAADRAPDTLHALRRSAKKLRYLVELGGRAVLGKDASERLIDGLKELQDTLGHIHDLDVL